MRIVEIALQNFRSLGGPGHRTFTLAPLTLLVGGNGAGKSSVLGAIRYALTGRYPGMQVHTVERARALARGRADFEVRLTSAEPEVVIERSLRGARFGLRTTGEGIAASRNVEEAEITIARAFGDPAWMLDAFDPVRSVWQLSDEAWTRWVYGICTYSSGWTKERLVNALGAPTDDWDPDVASDPAACLEITLARAEERLRAARTVAREARSFVGAISDDAAPAAETVAQARERWAHATQTALALRQTLAEAQAEERLEQELRQQAQAIEAAIDREAEGQAEALQVVATTRILELDAARNLYLRALVAGEEREKSLNKGCCTQCGGRPLTWRPPTHTAAEIEQLKQAFLAANKRCLEATAAAWRFEDAQQRVAEARAAVSLAQGESDRRRIERLAAGLATARDVPRIEGELQDAVREHDDLRLAFDALLASEGLAREKKGQLDAAHAAEARLMALSVWIDRLRGVRAAMLHDGVGPLRTALDACVGLAPRGLTFRLDASGAFVAVRNRNTVRRTADDLSVESLSNAERLRATIALIVAVAQVRRAPWTGLLIDNFERIAPGDRGWLLQHLAKLAEENVVQNVVVAAVGDAADWATVVGHSRMIDIGRGPAESDSAVDGRRAS